MEKPLGESGLYCEGGTESVHSLPSSPLLYHTNLVLQACLNMNFKPPLYAETPLILKVSAGLAVKVALTCRTTFC